MSPLNVSTREVLIPVATALAGALIGATIGEIRAALNNLREKRKMLRTLLFELLELRWQVRQREPSRFLRAYREAVGRIFGESAASQLDAPRMKALATSSLRALVTRSSGKGSSDAFRASVVALAPYEPVFAYQLHGQEGILELETAFEHWLAGAQVELGEHLPEGSDGGASDMIQSALTKAYLGALDVLRKDALGVAWQLDPPCWWRALRAVQRQDHVRDEEIEEFCRAMFRRFIPMS